MRSSRRAALVEEGREPLDGVVRSSSARPGRAASSARQLAAKRAARSARTARTAKRRLDGRSPERSASRAQASAASAGSRGDVVDEPHRPAPRRAVDDAAGEAEVLRRARGPCGRQARSTRRARRRRARSPAGRGARRRWRRRDGRGWPARGRRRGTGRARRPATTRALSSSVEHQARGSRPASPATWSGQVLLHRLAPNEKCVPLRLRGRSAFSARRVARVPEDPGAARSSSRGRGCCPSRRRTSRARWRRPRAARPRTSSAIIGSAIGAIGGAARSTSSSCTYGTAGKAVRSGRT